MLSKHFFFLILLGFFSLEASPVFAQGETDSQEIALYLPYHSSQFPELAMKLDAALNRAELAQIKTKSTDYWHPYQQGLRQGRTGIYLAAPHFTAWAINKHKFAPLLRLPDRLKYVIASRSDDAHLFEVNDLAGRSVCSQNSVNLDFMLVRTAFGNSFLAAQNKVVNSVARAMQYDNQNCDAFSVSEHLFKRFNLESPYRFIRLQQGNEYNNYAFVAHPGITKNLRMSLKKFLRSPDAQTVLKPLLKQFSNKTNLVPIKPTDYPNTYLKPLELYWR